ncbi:24909_t:CDS:1, partial [Gigaspora margarita]
NESISEIIFKEWSSIIGNKSDIIKNKGDFFNYMRDIIKNKSGSRIKKQFSESDEINKNLPMITEKLNNIYTSKPYIISEI